jgi:Holliday junction DNA helicase RuvA
MLSSITPVEIQNAIIKADVALIQQIKGIGAKSAQRIVLELQDKLKKEGPDTLIAMPLQHTTKDEALSALVMLGFGKQLAEKAIDQAIKKADQELTVEQMIKVALKNL